MRSFGHSGAGLHRAEESSCCGHGEAERHGLERVAAAGIGEWLIAEAANTLGMECILLSELYGSRISDVFLLMQPRGY